MDRGIFGSEHQHDSITSRLQSTCGTGIKTECKYDQYKEYL